ncbi:haloacid dehalogenase type II [Amycolatopsis jiangsuensis]|uniref:2-haloacid dehalogenase n=1 Tax=Amycolatopsis jiangsuensis TaxID=1181879 RepID=A0A840IY67_9PSEU|nr:haloacid dehalogenase type II [Amycolatopsis jiangsuensis]MBB4686643.1 2-haloacid dehalogenase [Amycolatopsis jiangsuensis]
MLCVFDVNETLLDLTTLDPLFTELTGSPTARREWFALSIHTVLAVTATGGYRDFGEITAQAAADVCAQYGHELTDRDLSRLREGLAATPAHPDAAEGLDLLRQDGHQLVALTNSPLATGETHLQNAGLATKLERIFSAQQVSRLKPAPEPYRQVLRAYGVEPGQAVMVAAHGWDIAGAQAAGLRTALLVRPGVRPLPGAPAATYTAASVPELARAIDVSHRSGPK